MPHHDQTMNNHVRSLSEGDFSWTAVHSLLGNGDPDVEEGLFHAARETAFGVFHGGVFVRGLIEFSNRCGKNCLYCGIRNRNTEVDRYSLTAREITDAAGRAVRNRVWTVVLQSGEIRKDHPDLPDVIRSIRKTTGAAVTLSIGEKDFEEYDLLRDAGADRFLLRIETTNPDLYHRCHPDSDLGRRKACLSHLKRTGYETGTGFLIGLPGQTLADIADDICFIREFQPDMIGIGPFIPHPDTPLGGHTAGDLRIVLRAVAILRLICPGANIPATTAMGTVQAGGQTMALRAGANVLMPNFTPLKFRDKYEIYPGKNRLKDIDPIQQVHDTIRQARCFFHEGPGPSPAWTRRMNEMRNFGQASPIAPSPQRKGVEADQR